MPTELRGERVVLRPVAGVDKSVLVAIRSSESVRRWWRGDDLAAEFDEELSDDEVHRFVIETLDGRVVGLIQFVEEDDPDYRHASIDVYVDPEVHRRGYATAAIGVLIDHLFSRLGHHRLTIDPSTDNAAAIACYTKIGFRRVGRMTAYERRPDGTWGDGILMELIRPDN